MTTPTEALTEQPAGDVPSGFSVRVGEFEGPFDLLLTLISKHKLEVTELALHQVTDEFIAYIRGQGHDWDLDEASGFLVVAATLLDLKAARLLPSGEVEDEEDLALLEARDLLFARLLQYRAYKEVSALFAERMAGAAKRYPADGRPRAAVRRPPARGADRHRSRAVRRDGRAGPRAEAGGRGVDRAHPHAARERARAGGDHRRPAAAAPDHDVPRARSRTARPPSWSSGGSSRSSSSTASRWWPSSRSRRSAT